MINEQVSGKSAGSRFDSWLAHHQRKKPLSKTTISGSLGSGFARNGAEWQQKCCHSVATPERAGRFSVVQSDPAFEPLGSGGLA